MKRIGRWLRPAALSRSARAFVRGVHHPAPVFVVGVPRSGTSSVEGVLAASNELASLPGEGTLAWMVFHHPARSGWESGVVGRGEVGRGERRLVDAFFYPYACGGRFVEKTPGNSQRIPYLLDLYPDASIVAARRNPPDVISSLIDGWRRDDGTFAMRMPLPEPHGIPGVPLPDRWRFHLPPGWRELRGRPVEEVALAQWEAASEAIEAARPEVPAGRYADVFVEELAAEPERVAGELCAAARIEPSAGVLDAARRLAREGSNVSGSVGVGKWRERNRAEIERVLPRIAELAPRFGYEVDPATGEFAVARERKEAMPGG